MDISATLGGLVRTTLQQVGVVKDAVERQARSSRMRLDEVMLQRKRRDALARVGELIHELALQGKLGDIEEDVPELAELLADVEDVEEQLGEQLGEQAGEQAEVEAVSSADWKPPARAASDREPLRVWRPVMPGGDGGEDDQAPATVQPAAPQAHGHAAEHHDSGPHAGRPGRAAQRARGGGITFVADDVGDDDHDLAEYMNDDDVPAKPG